MAEDSQNLNSFWERVTIEHLAQGDFLPACSIPIVLPDFGTDAAVPKVRIDEQDLIVMTQSCDLENGKALLVACCPIHTLAQFEQAMPSLQKSGAWETVRQGRVEGLHLLASTKDPSDKWDAYAVDFRSIYSLPVGYLTAHAKSLQSRWRLRSPYVEHFSQAFARFFMRVGLPSAIPAYNKPPLRPGSSGPIPQNPIH